MLRSRYIYCKCLEILTSARDQISCNLLQRHTCLLNTCNMSRYSCRDGALHQHPAHHHKYAVCCHLSVAPPGSYMEKGTQGRLCPKGTYSEGNNKNVACPACPDGTTTLKEGSTSILACNRSIPGYQMIGPTEAELCPLSYYNDKEGANCTLCPNGECCHHQLPDHSFGVVIGRQPA